MSDKEKQEFKEALYDPKNGRYTQDMLGIMTYLINTRGDQGLNVKGSPTFAKAMLSFTQSVDSKKYQNILESGDLTAFGNSAKEVAYIFDDLRGAYEEISRSKTSDGSLSAYNILTTNRDSIRPTVNNEKNNKEETLFHYFNNSISTFSTYTYFRYTWFLFQSRGDTSYSDGCQQICTRYFSSECVTEYAFYDLAYYG